MLNIFNSFATKLDNLNKTSSNDTKIKNYPRDYPPSVREWKNSIYVYNKKALYLIPESSKLSLSFFKSYFNLHNYKLEKKMRREKILRRFRRLSSHKIYVSDGEFKHTNNKVLITLYIYNRHSTNLIKKIYKRFLRKFRRKSIKRKLFNKFRSLKLNLEIIKDKLIKSNIKIDNYKDLNISKPNLNIRQLINLILYRNYLNKFFFKFKKRSFKRFKRYFRYKRLLYINRSKFNYTYLKHLINMLKKIYNKNVELNLVNLKYFYLNSYILSQSITLKVTRNRRRLLRVLNRSIRKPKIRRRYWIDSLMNLRLKFSYLSTKDVLNNILFEQYPINFFINKNLKKKAVLDLIKYKEITGIRLEAKGRLTRRYTASRSKYKARYKGNLKNTDSSLNNLPSLILRGNTRSNLQYTKLKSKSRIGSFGIKGWVSAT